jgi:hypothetical protein
MIHEMAMEREDYHYHEGWQTESVDFQGLLGMFDWDRECRSNNRLLLRFGPVDAPNIPMAPVS